MAYSEKVVEHYENPRNVGAFGKDEADTVGTGMVGAPACGDVMKLQIKVGAGHRASSKTPSSKPTAAVPQSHQARS